MPQTTTISTFFSQLVQRLREAFQKLKAHIPLDASYRSKNTLLRVYALAAHQGDCLLIEFLGNDDQMHYIWVDGGLVKSYHSYGQAVAKQLIQDGAKVDLLVVSHIDQDHIGGILAMLADPTIPADWIQQFWFNSGETLANWLQEDAEDRQISFSSWLGTRSVRQGNSLEAYLKQQDRWHDMPIKQFSTLEIAGARIAVLTPSPAALLRLHKHWQQENQDERSMDPNDYSLSLEALYRRPERADASLVNASSISFVMEYGAQRILMLADAWASDVVDSLQKLGYSKEAPLQIDLVKLSHHASRASISEALLNLIACDTFLICTDGSRYQLPHKETFARILLHPNRDQSKPIQFIFNQNNPTLQKIFEPKELLEYNFFCSFPQENPHGNIWTAHP